MTPRTRPRSLVLILALVAFSVLLLLVNFIGQGRVAQGPLSVITAPVQQVFTDIGRTISSFFRSTGDLNDLRTRAEQMQREMIELRAENLRLREFQASIEQYRNLLKFAEDNPAYSVVGADVIGIGDTINCKDKLPESANAGKCANVIAGDSSPFIRYVTINVGERDGVKVGMPVVGGGLALVGRVGEVSYASSQVQLLTDPTSFINVRLVESRATGTVNGTTEGTLVLQNVPQTEVVNVGDIIITSGLGGTLPAALPIGTVEQIISQDVETSQRAVIRPGVDFERLETVLVITAQRAAQITPTLTPTATP